MKKQQILIIHGGTVFDNYSDYLNALKGWDYEPGFSLKSKRWKSGLQEKLGDEWEVHLPIMPNKYNAKYLEWEIWFKKVIPFINNGVILLGHSLGGTFLLKYLSENDLPFKIKALFLVAPAFKADNGWTLGDFNFKINSKKIENKVEKLILMHSRDDMIVPLSHSEEIEKELSKAELIIFEDRGHFLQEDFPEIIEKIKKISGE